MRSLEHQFQPELDLARRIRRVRFSEVFWELIITGVRSQSGGSGALNETCGIGREAIGGDGNALVVAVEKVERLDDEVEFVALAQMNLTDDAQVDRRKRDADGQADDPRDLG